MDNFWLFEIGLGLLFLLCVNFGLKHLFKIFKRRIHLGKQEWKRNIEPILFRPMHLFLITLGAAYIVDVLSLQFDLPVLYKYTNVARNAGVVIILSWTLLRGKREIQRHMLQKIHKEHLKMDAASLHFIGKLLTIMIVFISFLIILQLLRLDIMPLIAFGGIGAAAVGFAGKDVIANFFGGMMLHITRPFVIEDQVEIKKEGIKGYIEEIGWYMTCIRLIDKMPVYVPNSLFSTAMVVNLSRMTHRMMDKVLSLRYEDYDLLQSLLPQIRQLLLNDADVDQEQPVIVNFENYSNFSLDIIMRAYIKKTGYAEFMQVQERLLLKIKELLRITGADIPFPTSVIELKKQP